MHSKKLFTHRRIAGVAALVLTGALFLSGTFAWNDYRQHKTNEANASGILYKARLVEDYNPNDAKDWKITDSLVKKTISVKNPGAETDDDTSNYGDIFVRVQLKEFMEFFPITYIRTPERYMTDANGDFLVFDTLAEAQNYVSDLEDEYGNSPHVIKQLRIYNTSEDVTDDNLPYYIQTKESDPNGIYGDFVIIDIEVDYLNPKNIILDNAKIPSRASNAQTGNHNDHTNNASIVDIDANCSNGECLYTPHTWEKGLYGFNVNGEPNTTFSDYIDWIFGDDVITYEQWQNNFDGKPVEKWVVDTTSSEGWIYWLSPIAPKKSTTNLMEAMDLIKQPGDAFYYALHADMQAVCFQELDNWNNSTPAGNIAPTDIISALKTSYNKISNIIVSPDTAFVQQGHNTTFTANVRGSDGVVQDVTWKIEGSNNVGTSIDQNGKLTVDANETSGTTITVIATSTLDNSISGKAYVTVKAETP